MHIHLDLSSNEAAEIGLATHSKKFEISIIRAATDYFSAENMIATTAFGCLYKVIKEVIKEVFSVLASSPLHPAPSLPKE